jgi:beta-lactamase superfamily II metal-dependent hydrolase
VTRLGLAAGLLAAVLVTVAPAGALAQGTLDIYLIDVEGGNATLIVAPSGESLLIDTGNGGENAARDAGRIADAVRAAGLEAIDHLVITHYHGDHSGGTAALAALVPIREYIDHGPSVQPPDAFLAEVYPALYGAAAHRVVSAGDGLALGEADLRFVTSAGTAIAAPLPGAGAANPYCAGVEPQAPDDGENAQSVGTHVTFGEFRAVHLGDLTWNVELALMCPANRLGTVDALFVSHHGQPSSNSPALVHALAPRVALMNNGTRKGGQPDAMRVLHASPGLEDLWQLHFSLLSGQEYTVPGLFIANGFDEPPPAMPVAPLEIAGGGGPPAPSHQGEAFWLKVSARPDGTFIVTNARNGFSKTYAP